MMAGTDELFDQQIHDAYERVRLSDDAQDRMLAALLVAQEERGMQQASALDEQQAPTREERQVPAQDEQPPAWDEQQYHAQEQTPAWEDDQAPEQEDWAWEGRRAPATFARRKWLRWLVTLPVAAAIVGVALVLTLPRRQEARRESAPSAAASNEAREKRDSAPAAGDAGASKSEEVAASEVTLEEAAPEADAVAYDADASTDTLRTVDAYPFVELSDGTTLTALIDGIAIVEVDAQRVGELVDEGQAGMADANTSQVPCAVYRLTDDDQAYAVQYEGEDTYWYCTVI